MKAIAVAIVSFAMVLERLVLILGLMVVACEAQVEGDGEPEPTQEELDELSCAVCTLEVCVGSLNRCEDRAECERVLECVQDEAANAPNDSEDGEHNAAFACADRHNLLREQMWRDAAVCSETRCGACGDSPLG